MDRYQNQSGASPIASFEAGLLDKVDEGCFALVAKNDVQAFAEACRTLRHWEREAETKMKGEEKPPKKKPR